MKTSIKKEVIKFAKALAHGILIPSMLALATLVPEPAGFYVLALSYLYGMLITWSIIEEGVYHVC